MLINLHVPLMEMLRPHIAFKVNVSRRKKIILSIKYSKTADIDPLNPAQQLASLMRLHIMMDLFLSS